jgi:hypothetical protein
MTFDFGRFHDNIGLVQEKSLGFFELLVLKTGRRKKMPQFERGWYERIDLRNWTIFLGELVKGVDVSTVPQIPIDTLYWLMNDPILCVRLLGPAISDLSVNHRLMKYLQKQVRRFSPKALEYLHAKGYKVFSVPVGFNLAHPLSYWSPNQIEEDDLLYLLWHESAWMTELAWLPYNPFVPGGVQTYRDSVNNLQVWSKKQDHKSFDVYAIVPNAAVAGWILGNLESVRSLIKLRPVHDSFATWTSTVYKGKRIFVFCDFGSEITGGPIMSILPHYEDVEPAFTNFGLIKILRPALIGEGVI